MNTHKPMTKTTEKIEKKLNKKEISDLSIILGQMSYSQSVVFKGQEYLMIQKNVFDDWFKKIKKAIEINL